MLRGNRGRGFSNKHHKLGKLFFLTYDIITHLSISEKLKYTQCSLLPLWRAFNWTDGWSETITYRHSCHRCCSETREAAGRFCRCSSTWAWRSGCWSERCGSEVGVSALRGRSHWQPLWNQKHHKLSFQTLHINTFFDTKSALLVSQRWNSLH